MYEAQNAVSDRGKSRPIRPPPPAAGAALDGAGADVVAAAGVDAAGAAAELVAAGAAAELVAGAAFLELLHAVASRSAAETTADACSPLLSFTFSP
jgi:hypothetical protein